MTWLLLDHGAGVPAANMAWDEALLEQAPVLRRPVLRLYGWSEPAATFGYFQKYAGVAALTPLRPLLRRPTGGGLVPHAADWTYSLAIPPGHPWYELRAVASYQRMHEWIQAAFSRMGLATHLATEPRRVAPGQCFVGAERFDLLLDERKIAGAAQRRTRDGLLIQGSIQPPPGARRRAFDTAFADVARQLFGGENAEFEPGDELHRRVTQLIETKYASPAYNECR